MECLDFMFCWRQVGQGLIKGCDVPTTCTGCCVDWRRATVLTCNLMSMYNANAWDMHMQQPMQEARTSDVAMLCTC